MINDVIAIDPGTELSAVVRWQAGKIVLKEEWSNPEMNAFLKKSSVPDLLALEMVACYGMPVGKETFETCLWIGRFIESAALAGIAHRLCYRIQIKNHLCHSSKAKDGNVAQALRDKIGPVGVKKQPGPLYGVSGHLWQALAVAIYASETQEIPTNI